MLSLFRRRLDTSAIDALRNANAWTYCKDWTDCIDQAVADNDSKFLQQLYDQLAEAIAERPWNFPLWFLLEVPREIEDEVAKKIDKNSNYLSLHRSLQSMELLEQKKIVEQVVKLWIKRDPDAVPMKHKQWVGMDSKPVPTAPNTVKQNVTPYGAIADTPVYQQTTAPRFTIDDPDAQNTEFVKSILLQRSKVRFIGEEGSGKTSKARWLCRERMALGHTVFWINPHLKADDKSKLEACNVTIVGGGRDYQAIADFCTRMAIGDNSKLSQEYKRYSNEVGAVFAPVTIVLDELTNYKEEVGEPIEKLIKASMQEFSKINWHTVYIAHNDTLSCMGAPAGTANLIKSSVFDLKLEADPTKGNRIPKSVAKYRMPNTDNWLDVTIPKDWQ